MKTERRKRNEKRRKRKEENKNTHNFFYPKIIYKIFVRLINKHEVYKQSNPHNVIGSFLVKIIFVDD